MNSSLAFMLEGTDNLYQLGDDVSYIRGRHNFKFGGQAIERRFYYPTQSNDKGSFTFSPVYTRACPDGNAPCQAAAVNGQFSVPGPTAIPQPNANPRATFRFLPGYYPVSQVHEWSASIQHRLPGNWGAEISYQGTHAIHLPQFVDVNAPALPQGPLANVPINDRRRFPQWGVVGSWKPIGYSRYNGLAASLRNANWHGLSVQSSFTFAKNIASSILGTSDQGNTHGAYPYIWEGPAELTPRLRSVTAFSYDLPFGIGRRYAARGVTDWIAGGWTLAGIADFTTGAWRRVITNDVSGTGYGVMPNRICDPRQVPGGRNRFQWFNTACFENPPFGTWGNSPMGVYEDPGINNWNLSIHKSFPVKLPAEGARLTFRTDFFNAFNHTQWGPASNSTLQSGNVNSGRITSTRAPRQIQFSLTYSF